MSSAVFIISGLTADTGVILYFGWVTAAIIVGAIFKQFAGTGPAGLTIASALVAPAALLAASHAVPRHALSPARSDQIFTFRLSYLFGVTVCNESTLSPRSSPPWC